jgi:hypothetical protein
MIFVNSISDLFHKDIPRAHIAAVFDTMEKADWHTYQVLTKRSSLLLKFINDRYKDRTAPPHMLVWGFDRKRASHFAHRTFAEGTRRRPLPLHRAAYRSCRSALSQRHSLGDCRR